MEAAKRVLADAQGQVALNAPAPASVPALAAERDAKQKDEGQAGGMMGRMMGEKSQAGQMMMEGMSASASHAALAGRWRYLRDQYVSGERRLYHGYMLPRGDKLGVLGDRGEPPSR